MKMVGCVVLLGLAVALALPAIAQDQPADIYKAKCAMCHGADGSKSMGGSKPLSGADVQGMSDADLNAAITNGKGKMPAYKGKLTDAQITGLVGYVRTLKK
jgi:mono/diheme cytochrome c family protein